MKIFFRIFWIFFSDLLRNFSKEKIVLKNDKNVVKSFQVVEWVNKHLTSDLTCVNDFSRFFPNFFSIFFPATNQKIRRNSGSQWEKSLNFESLKWFFLYPSNQYYWSAGKWRKKKLCRPVALASAPPKKFLICALFPLSFIRPAPLSPLVPFHPQTGDSPVCLTNASPDRDAMRCPAGNDQLWLPFDPLWTVGHWFLGGDIGENRGKNSNSFTTLFRHYANNF